jgi:hypothetical protein
MADLLDHDMTETESETTLELNFAVLKLKHTTKRKKELAYYSKIKRIFSPFLFKNVSS